MDQWVTEHTYLHTVVQRSTLDLEVELVFCFFILLNEESCYLYTAFQ